MKHIKLVTYQQVFKRNDSIKELDLGMAILYSEQGMGREAAGP